MWAPFAKETFFLKSIDVQKHWEKAQKNVYTAYTSSRTAAADMALCTNGNLMLTMETSREQWKCSPRQGYYTHVKRQRDDVRSGFSPQAERGIVC